jgi:hypothetical protein
VGKTYTVQDARNAGEKDNPHGGKLVKWYLDLEELREDGSPFLNRDVYTQKKPGNDLVAGQTIYGRIEQGEYGPRFYSEQDPGTGLSAGKTTHYDPQAPPDNKDAQINRAVAFKGAIEVAAAYASKYDSQKQLLEAVASMTDEFLAIVEGPDVQEKVSEVAQTLSAGPQKAEPSEGAPITRETLATAYNEYLRWAGEEGTVDRELAQNKVQLKLTALGVNSYDDMDDGEIRDFLAFLREGPQLKDTTPGDVPF